MISRRICQIGCALAGRYPSVCLHGATRSSGHIHRRVIMTSPTASPFFKPYGPEANCRFQFSDDNACFEVTHPGWSINELNQIMPLLDQPFYLRSWKITQFIDLISESAKKLGMLDIIRYEDTHMTYFRCIELEKLISAKELDDLGSLPFQYGLKVKWWLSRMGGTSFQINAEISESASQRQMFQFALVVVSVDKSTRQVVQNPAWFADKYRDAALKRPGKLLRSTLPQVFPKENLISDSVMIVQPLDLDYYGHGNNSSYMLFAMNAILNAERQNKLSWSYKELEISLKKMECDFVSDCNLGDKLDMFVYRDSEDTNKLYVTLCKAGKVIYVQMMLYEPPQDSSKL